MGYGDSSHGFEGAGRSVKLTIDLQLVSRIKKRRSIYIVPVNTSSRRSSQSDKHRDTVTFHLPTNKHVVWYNHRSFHQLRDMSAS
jgi:hypothetical protein